MAYIIGGGKRLAADTIDILFYKIDREKIRIHQSEQVRARNVLLRMPEVMIRGSRQLSQNEMLLKHFRNPLRRIEENENVQIRIVRHKR